MAILFLEKIIYMFQTACDEYLLYCQFSKLLSVFFVTDTSWVLYLNGAKIVLFTLLLILGGGG